ncbi:MAG: hypothetical protein F4026_06730, partial [Synechococcus sp. SB0669_bin_8]|nr:hypothetical protein [Synechococcus sp. SB0669_bin_8]
MTLHSDLLEQAFHLAMRERKKPRQASLRRSVSTSYYALFHLLIDAAIKRAFPGEDRAPLRHYLARTISHADIKNIAQDFSRASVPENLCPILCIDTLDERLVFIAEAFIQLQNARLNADYNLSEKFVKSKVIELVIMTKRAFDCWEEVNKTIEADVFLFRMLNR